MALKSKIMGTLAAVGLSVSMLASVAAAPSSDSVSGSVELKEGFCQVTLTDGAGDFGKFTYTGSGYARSEGTGIVYFSGNIAPSKPNGKCDVTVQTTGLNGASGVIGSEHFRVNFNGSTFYPLGAGLAPGSYTFENRSERSGTVGIEMKTAPANYTPGIYSGTLSITVNNGD